MRRIIIELGGQWVENPVAYLPGVISEAALLEDKAPETCKALWDRLPMETRTTHSFFSGQAWRTEHNYPLRKDDDPIENAAQDMEPGDVFYFGSPEAGNYKICFSYSKARWASQACHMGRIDKNLAGFIEASRRTLYQGPLTLSIRRKE